MKGRKEVRGERKNKGRKGKEREFRAAIRKGKLDGKT